MPLQIDKGFATIERTWSPNDMVELTLPMPVKFNKAVDMVDADRNRVAITKGPLVYCAEGVDNNGLVQRFYINTIPTDDDINNSVISDGVMKQIVTISISAMDSQIDKTNPQRVELIPYYSWNNRGDSSMIVWFAEEKDEL